MSIHGLEQLDPVLTAYRPCLRSRSAVVLPSSIVSDTAAFARSTFFARSWTFSLAVNSSEVLDIAQSSIDHVVQSAAQIGKTRTPCCAVA